LADFPSNFDALFEIFTPDVSLPGRYIACHENVTFQSHVDRSVKLALALPFTVTSFIGETL
jgi:hypothetical protein